MPRFNQEKAFRTCSPFFIYGLLAFGSLAVLPHCADAQTSLVASGDWDVIDNWSNGVPTSSNYAIVDNNLTVSVPVGIEGSAADLYVGYSGTGALNLNGGTVNNNFIYIGANPTSNGTVTITSGTWTSAGYIYVGHSGTGALNIDGGTVTNNHVFIGTNQNSNGTATITSGTLATVGGIITGYYGTGAFNINGGTVTSDYAIISANPTSNGTATITSGTWANSRELYVGLFGTGALNINGGVVTSSTGIMGYSANTNGTVTVTSGTWASSGDLYVGLAGTGTLNLSGSGVVSVNDGTGWLILGSNTGSVGTLNLGNGDTAGTLQAAVVTGGSGTAVVNFNHTGDYTFAPQLTGNLSVNKLGSGTTILTGSNTYTGHTMVQSGELLVNGSIVSDVTVAGGLLGGSGFIGGNVVNQGQVSPGNSPGILTIGGDYTQASTGSLLIQIASGASYDKLMVGGNVVLGGTLQVSLLNGFKPTKGSIFDFIALTGTGTMTGTFATVESNTVLKFVLGYLSTGVSLVATQGLFADVAGLTPNQLVVAKELDKIVEDPGVFGLINYLNGIDETAIPQALEKIVPTDLIPMFDAVIAANQTQAFNLERRMTEIQNGATGFSAIGLRLSDSHGTRSYNGNSGGKQAIGKDGKTLDPAPISDRWGFFINGSGEFVDEESTAIARGTDFTTGGITTGADYRLGNHAAVGVTAGYANTSSNGRTDDAVKIDSGKLGLYGTVFNGGFFLNGIVGGGLNSYETRRDTLGGLARGDAEGADFNALLGTGYTYRKGGLSAGPIASMRYSWVGIDGFTERGSLAPLNIGEQSEASLKSTVGLQTSYAFQLGKVGVTPQIRAQWQHEYLDAARGIGASFLPGGSFTVYGPQIGRDSLLLDVGTSVQLTQAVGIYTFYTGNLGGQNYTSHAINGGVQISF